jgi:PAS domain-containing protein
MATNFYFQSGDTSGTTAEQRLVEDLIIESLKIYGHDIYYMPRTLVNRDTIFDEDELSKFEQAYPLEMYMENVDGFGGDGELFSRFGLEVRDQATFVLSRRRWQQLVDTSGGTFTLDDRPSEGDLLYFPKTRSLFEIKFVEFQDPFYQLGQIYVFRMQCELFEYSSEEIETGYGDIDQLEDDNTVDQLLFELNLEGSSTDVLKLESGGSLIKEDYSIKPAVQGDNADFNTEQIASNILDFTESNPFGEL